MQKKIANKKKTATTKTTPIKKVTKVGKKKVSKVVKKASTPSGNIKKNKVISKEILKKFKNLDLTVEETLKETYILRLYITGSTPQSQLALSNIRRICEEHLKNHYELQVIDIYQSPALAKNEQIIAAPTLIKILPHPLRRLIGDLSNEDRVLLGLDVQKNNKKK